MKITDEAVEAAAEAAARSEDIAWDVTYLRDAYRKLARAALEGAVPIITEQTRQEVIALARWLMHAELTESLEVLDILAGGDTSKALARVLDAPWG